MKTKEHIPYGPYERFFKRPIDMVLSFLALAFFSPILLFTSLFVWGDLGSPILFKQERTGINGKKFYLLKFRSMMDIRDVNGTYLPDEKRITKFGRFIRNTSLDELPSLLNILKGDMSIIGPRPLPVRYTERYTRHQKRRLEVLPGLSNTAVIQGRNQQTWEEQFEKDVWYVDHISLRVDLKAVIDTIKIVISRKGVTAADGGCRGEFIGRADIEDVKADKKGDFIKI